jgi:L-amino acid N-acyltransferase YncA
VTAYRLRLASAADAEAICRIYNQGIEDRVATLETELRTPDERRQWLAGRDARHPVIVAETEPNTSIGWASLNVFNARESYRFVADVSVYVERGWRGKGVGKVLLEKLTELGRTHGYHNSCCPRFPATPAAWRSTRSPAFARWASTTSRVSSMASGSTRSSWRSSWRSERLVVSERES